MIGLGSRMRSQVVPGPGWGRRGWRAWRPARTRATGNWSLWANSWRVLNSFPGPDELAVERFGDQAEVAGFDHPAVEVRVEGLDAFPVLAAGRPGS